eukprot:3800016-Karenia_brevis.AAC.1
MRPLIEQQYGAGGLAPPDLICALAFLELALPMIQPVSIPVSPSPGPVHNIYTDACWEERGSTLNCGLGG